MAYKRKYRIGDRITSMDQLANQQFVYCRGKILHNGWFMSWQFRMAKNAVDRGCVFAAIKNDEDKTE